VHAAKPIEFSFRPNTPVRVADAPTIEDVLQCCNEVLAQRSGQQSSQFISLIEKLDKACANGLTWEEALQMLMVKTHMQTKAILFWQRNTKRKCITKWFGRCLEDLALKSKLHPALETHREPLNQSKFVETQGDAENQEPNQRINSVALRVPSKQSKL
jgi:hypothetical protein